MSRHSFGRRWVDATSIQPERIPAHRAPKHRADVPIDSCSSTIGGPLTNAIPCPVCRFYEPRHRAEERAA